MNTAGKIAVAGATGRVGRHVVDVLTEQGHEVIAISRSNGVDVVTGDGLAEALNGVESVVDAATGASPEQHAATEFFTAATRNMQRLGAQAGVRRIVVVSIIGIDPFAAGEYGGYYVAKQAHERAMLAGPIPATIVRAAQFHEFVPQLMDWGRQNGTISLPKMRTQLVAARTVAELLAEVATGDGPAPASASGGAPILEIAGPREENLVDAARLLAAHRGETVRIEAVNNPDDPGAALYESGALLPGPDAILAGPTFAQWLAGQANEEAPDDMQQSSRTHSATASPGRVAPAPAATTGRIELSAGTIEYRDTGGEGPPIVLLHGLMMDATLWDGVVADLAVDHRCIVPTLPLGAHRYAMGADADLSMRGIARIVAEFVDRLDLDEATLVGNDTGGALVQLLAGDGAVRGSRIVLVSCEAFDNFPPGLTGKTLVLTGKLPPSLFGLVMQQMRFRPFRRLPIAFGWLTMRGDATSAQWIRPVLKQPEIRRDTVRLLRAIAAERDLMLEAAEHLSDFDAPALVVWASEDRVMPPTHGHRLAQLLPQGRLVEIPDSYTLVPLDQPIALAQAIREFTQQTDAQPSTAREAPHAPTPAAEPGKRAP